MSFARALAFVLASTLALPLVAAPAVAGDREARAKARYRMGDDADEANRRRAAEGHRADLSTPRATMETWRAAVVRRDVPAFLGCLTDELRARKYPRGVKSHIKFFRSPKYRYLVMYADFGEARQDGENAVVPMVVEFRRASGGLRTQRIFFDLERRGGDWRLVGLGRKGPRR